MSGTVIQGAFLGGQPRLASVPPRLASPPIRVPPPIQAKSAVRPPATAFAGRPPGAPEPVFTAGPPTPAFARRPGTVQRQGAGGAFAVEAGQLGLTAGGGRPLPDSVRGRMEAALGADFSTVRVHVGPQAERIGAIAFTFGSDIYFAPGRYQPETVHGQQLLGHELAHVVQQRAGRVRNPLGAGLAVVQDHALEAEADRLGQRAAAHRVAAQAKMPSGAAQPSAPVRISPPVAAGPGRYRLTAGTGGRPVGSVMVHAREKGAVEVTDLNVTEAQRGHGIGQMLLASAARTGRQFGKSKVTLAAQDSGSGRLTRWYKEMGFAQVGVNRRGYAQLEAPISRVLAGAVQRRELPLGWISPARSGVVERRTLLPLAPSLVDPPQPFLRFARVAQRMEARGKETESDPSITLGPGNYYNTFTASNLSNYLFNKFGSLNQFEGFDWKGLVVQYLNMEETPTNFANMNEFVVSFLENIGTSQADISKQHDIISEKNQKEKESEVARRQEKREQRIANYEVEKNKRVKDAQKMLDQYDKLIEDDRNNIGSTSSHGGSHISIGSQLAAAKRVVELELKIWQLLNDPRVSREEIKHSLHPLEIEIAHAREKSNQSPEEHSIRTKGLGGK